MTALGLLALLFYLVHGTNHLLHGRAPDLLWACHLGAVLVGVGLLRRRAAWSGTGLSWLVLGNFMWALDLAGGGELIVTTVGTHVGGLALGFYGVRRLGWAPYTWVRAVLGLVVLWIVCRLVTPWGANVNLAFFVHPGWEREFPSFPAYLGLLLLVAVAVFESLEVIAAAAARRWGPPAPGPDTP